MTASIVPLDEASLAPRAATRSRDAAVGSGRGLSASTAYTNDAHERRVVEALRARLARRRGHRFVGSSMREDREYERFSTTVVNAALLPVVADTLEAARSGLRALRRDARRSS